MSLLKQLDSFSVRVGNLKPTYLQPFAKDGKPVAKTDSRPSRNVEPSISLTLNTRKQHQCDAANEALDVIHSKLYSDIMNIRTWNVNADYELQQKAKKLEASSQIIESQKKSILELQLGNENLSSRLKEELDKRTEIHQRLQSTQEMLFMVKDQMSIFEEKRIACESLKKIFEELNQQQVTEMEDLSEKFQNLQIDFTEKTNALKLQVTQMETENTQTRTLYNEQLSELQDKLEASNNDCNTKTGLVQKLEATLSDVTSEMNDLKVSSQRLEFEVKELEVQLKEKTDKLDVTKMKLDEKANTLNELKNLSKAKIDEEVKAKKALEAAFNSLQEKAEEDLRDNEKKKDELKTQLMKKSNDLEQSQAQLKEFSSQIELLKSNSDVLKMNVADVKNKNVELDVKLKESIFERDNAMNRKQELENSLAASTATILKLQEVEKNFYKLQNELDHKSQLVNSLNVTLEELTKEKGILEDTVNDLKDKLKRLDEDSSEKANVIEDAEKSAAVLSSNLKAAVKELKLFQKEKLSLAEKANCLEKDINTLKEKLEAETSSWEREIHEEVTKRKELQKEICKMKKQDVLKSEQIASLQGEVEVRKEVVKELKDKVTSLESELKREALLDKTSDISKQLSEKNKELVSLMNELKTMKENSEEEKKVTERVREELENVKVSSEAKYIDLLRMMEKLEADYTKTAIEKQRELRGTKQAVEMLQQDLKFANMDLKDLGILKSELEGLKQEKCALEKLFKEKELIWQKEKLQMKKVAEEKLVNYKALRENEKIQSEIQMKSVSLDTQCEEYEHQAKTKKDQASTMPQTPVTSLHPGTSTTRRTPQVTPSRSEKQRTLYASPYHPTPKPSPRNSIQHSESRSTPVVKTAAVTTPTLNRKIAKENFSANASSCGTTTWKSPQAIELKNINTKSSVNNNKSPSFATKKSNTPEEKCTVEFDSDSSASGVTVGVKEALRLLDRNVKTQANRPKPPVKTNSKMMPSKLGSENQDVFNSLGVSNKKMKLAAPEDRRVVRAQRKFFKREPTPRPKTDWVDDSEYTSLFAED